MNQEDFLETARKYNELMKSLGIVTHTYSSRTGLDPNIPFSEIDDISIKTIGYEDGRKDVYERVNRYSHLMVWGQEVLENWGYKFDQEYKGVKRAFSPEFRFIHEDLPSIYIRSNSCHRNMFRVDDDQYFTVNTKEDWEPVLNKHIKYIIYKSGNKTMLRDLKLRELI